MEVWIPFNEFKKLIERGHQSGPVFESRESLVTTCGGLTVIATKTKPDRVFSALKGHEVYTLLRTGYRQISSEREGVIQDEETVIMIEELTRDLSRKLKNGIIKQMKETEQDAKSG